MFLLYEAFLNSSLRCLHQVWKLSMTGEQNCQQSVWRRRRQPSSRRRSPGEVQQVERLLHSRWFLPPLGPSELRVCELSAPTAAADKSVRRAACTYDDAEVLISVSVCCFCRLFTETKKRGKTAASPPEKPSWLPGWANSSRLTSSW